MIYSDIKQNTIKNKLNANNNINYNTGEKPKTASCKKNNEGLITGHPFIKL